MNKYKRGSNWISKNLTYKIRITRTVKQTPANWLMIEYYDLRGDRRLVFDMSPLGFDQTYTEMRR